MSLQTHRAYADTPVGQLHYSESGAGAPILLLHQAPRSLDEFAELQILLAANYRTIAMDMLGFGLSEHLKAPQTIEAMADGAVALLDALDIDSAFVLGHHTGAVVAHEVAARAPARVSALVLSGVPWIGPDERADHTLPPVDNVVRSKDGSHLTDLWQQRLPYYPAGRSDLLDRFIRDALAPGVDPAEGHRAVGRYEMDKRISHIYAPTLILAAEADPFSMPALSTVAAALINAKVSIHHIAGGTIPLMEQCAPEIAAAVHDFLQLLARPS